MRREFPFPLVSRDADDGGGADYVEAVDETVDEGNTDVDFGGLAGSRSAMRSPKVLRQRIFASAPPLSW